MFGVPRQGNVRNKRTGEQAESVSLDKIVSHKHVILPQLGAVGVAGSSVKNFIGLQHCIRPGESFGY